MHQLIAASRMHLLKSLCASLFFLQYSVHAVKKKKRKVAHHVSLCRTGVFSYCVPRAVIILINLEPAVSALPVALSVELKRLSAVQVSVNLLYRTLPEYQMNTMT